MKFNLQNLENSPKNYARTAGILYLIIIVMGFCAETFVRNKLFVSGDANATANNIINSPFLWKIGITADLIMQICDLPVMIILYYLLRPISKKLALLNLSFNLIQTAVLVANKLNLLAALFFLGDAEYLKTFTTDQLHTLAYLSIKLHDFGFGIGLIFFGFVCLFEGYLIFKSGYFPKVIGVLMSIAGICYLFNSFALILAPQLSSIMLLMPCLIAELSLSLWLIFKGVNLTIWKQKFI
ncbi:DUF4386 domain-containing protein [Flavobacterium reichenbachii]|uniref:DUF4386 domain-containing protein n=1 Tax=Flavobacterium reichenbachii TaxID=362418 RepID=A0A085ZFZ9_9FLAO|nr:DUF4386 domain-containing protein [Flavobacterium reichenbachii]KFF03363.1 hypothetical protein IW19_20970 [Flavobacterium reichenbachii]OXB16729.1 hypothetical protein B0A68_06260 [Flavobacterium reichenbachii]